ncbi:DUF4041 domain-containing protein [Anabaena sphaerica FACHB-251]|uniref:DUF4041 domain-containing protein n=1 Tax=Anabaena sphaerica FACHB-251 TaxID=2692883 RepID=A0A926WG50_9NOST|nr:DUF4041 domain-containing protein [Anabaena sphaerica FACHB-251]
MVLVAGLSAALVQSLIAESRLRKKLCKYDALDDKEAYQRQLESNIHLLENQQESLNREIGNLQQQFNAINAKLYLQSKDAYEAKDEFISSDEYILRLKDIHLQQENMRENNQAYICDTQWTVGDSKRKGDKMINDILNLVEVCFEEKCKYAKKEVKYNNVDFLKNTINKTFEKYNKYLKTLQCRIGEEYLHLKLIELDLQYELEDKKQQEQERDKEIRKQKKEREAFDKARKRAEDAEQREILHQQELDKIRQEVLQAKEEEKKQLETRIQELERLVAEDRSDKENALFESKKLKSGYIYIISNIGSLGQNIYRICMTFRSQEDIYIREMNPAVPFQFDVHFKIFSEDALDTLQNLHQRFDDKRVNKVNSRRDFFQVSINEIEAAIKEIKRKDSVFLRIDKFEKSPKASEYWQTQAARKKQQL